MAELHPVLSCWFVIDPSQAKFASSTRRDFAVSLLRLA